MYTGSGLTLQTPTCTGSGLTSLLLLRTCTGPSLTLRETLQFSNTLLLQTKNCGSPVLHQKRGQTQHRHSPYSLRVLHTYGPYHNLFPITGSYFSLSILTQHSPAISSELPPMAHALDTRDPLAKSKVTTMNQLFVSQWSSTTTLHQSLQLAESRRSTNFPRSISLLHSARSKRKPTAFKPDGVASTTYHHPQGHQSMTAYHNTLLPCPTKPSTKRLPSSLNMAVVQRYESETSKMHSERSQCALTTTGFYYSSGTVSFT